MSEYLTVHPDKYSIEELESAARGESVQLTPPMAVDILRAKIEGDARRPLMRIAQGDDFDLRARHVAIKELSRIPNTRGEMQELAGLADKRVADIARRVLDDSEDDPAV
ncbi:hypothetical protein [Nocardia beijingensis]